MGNVSGYNGMTQKIRKRRFLFAGVLIGIVLGLAACGKGEEPGVGVDGYVWVPRNIGGTDAQNASELPNVWTEQTMPGGFKTCGEWLYYVQTAQDGNAARICRIPLDGAFDFTSAETMVSVPSLGGYTVDKDQNLYYFIRQFGNAYNDSGSGAITLYGQSPEKETLFELELDKTAAMQYGYINNLAVGRNGDIFLLTDDSILRIDREGNVTDTVSTDEHRDEVSWMEEYLVETAEGIVYYVNVGDQRRVWECSGEGNMRFEEVSVLKAHNNAPDLYRNTEGILAANNDGTVSRYRKGQEAPELLLRWEDSDLFVDSMSEIAAISDDELLLLNNTDGKELYLLTRTPIEELPEKELVIMASLFPTENLRKAVVDFNRSSEEYHVAIENYGADPWYTGSYLNNEGAYARLDAAMSSKSGCPDILDLSYLDLYKYTDKGALEDLSAYMGTGSLRKEDFLDNLQDSFTIDGKLVCIPKFFVLTSVAGRTSQIGEKSGWTGEELMDLAAGRNGWIVANGESAQSMMEGIFSSYYLDAFIDWEKGECHFEDARFRTLMEWLRNHVGDGAEWIKGYLPDNVLLEERRLTSFSDYMELTEWFQEEIILKGYPSPEGKPSHRAQAIDALAIAAHAGHKKGAWEFLEFYLSKEEEGGFYFSTKKSILRNQAEDAATPLYSLDSEGNPQRREDGSYYTRTKLYLYVDGNPIPADCVPQEQVDAVLRAIDETDFAPESARGREIIDIVSEEAAYYFDGTKPLDQVIGIIQNRANVVVQTQG